MPDLTKGEFPSEAWGLLFAPLVLSVLLRLRETPRRMLEKVKLRGRQFRSLQEFKMQLNPARLPSPPTNEDLLITKFPSSHFSKILAYRFVFPFSLFRLRFPSDLWRCLYFKKSRFLTFWRPFNDPSFARVSTNCPRLCLEIAEIIFRPNSIDITFYYPRKNHKTLVTASCIPMLWKTFITSVTIFTKVSQFSQHYLGQQVITLLYDHPFCATKSLISLVDISEVPCSESSMALYLLYLPLVCGQWPGKNVSVL